MFYSIKNYLEFIDKFIKLMNFDLKVGFSIVDLLDMVIYNICIIVY